jgi:hypothetical protein
MLGKSRWNKSRVLAYLIVFVLIGCTEIRLSPPVVTVRHDMDNVINLKGIPRNLSEGFYGGTRHQITLYYPDAVYYFQTDEAKSYSALTGQQTINFGESVPQSALPLWFRTKYPNLNWKGVSFK